jgi:hypothetical protein
LPQAAGDVIVEFSMIDVRRVLARMRAMPEDSMPAHAAKGG